MIVDALVRGYPTKALESSRVGLMSSTARSTTPSDGNAPRGTTAPSGPRDRKIRSVTPPGSFPRRTTRTIDPSIHARPVRANRAEKPPDVARHPAYASPAHRSPFDALVAPDRTDAFFARAGLSLPMTNPTNSIPFDVDVDVGLAFANSTTKPVDASRTVAVSAPASTTNVGPPSAASERAALSGVVPRGQSTTTRVIRAVVGAVVVAASPLRGLIVTKTASATPMFVSRRDAREPVAHTAIGFRERGGFRDRRGADATHRDVVADMSLEMFACQKVPRATTSKADASKVEAMAVDEEMEDAGARDHEPTVAREDAENEEDDEEDEDSEFDDDSEDDDSEESNSEFEMPDDADMEKIMALERSCEENDWSDYVAALKLIDALRNAKLRERCRNAREKYNERFAFDEARWQEWIRDEIENKSESKTERYTRADGLFRRAIEECGRASVHLHLGRARNAMELGAGETERRAMYEEAVSGPGMNYIDGHLIWAAYRAFELAQPTPNVTSVKKLFFRQLAVPHSSSEATANAAREWMEEAKVKDASNAYEKALATGTEAKKIREPFEAQLVDKSTAPGQRLRAYKNYIDFEISVGMPDRVAHLYERAILEAPYVGELWRDYGAYLASIEGGRSDTSVSMSEQFMRRAVRACPSSGALWSLVLAFSNSTAFVGRALNAKCRDIDEYGGIVMACVDNALRGDQHDAYTAVGFVRTAVDQMKSSFLPYMYVGKTIELLKELEHRMMMTHSSSDDHAVELKLIEDLAEIDAFRDASEFQIYYAEYLVKHAAKKATILSVYDKALNRGTEPITLSKKTVDEASRRKFGDGIVMRSKMRYLAMVDRASFDMFVRKTHLASGARDYEFEQVCERLDAKSDMKKRGGSRRERAAQRRANPPRATTDTADVPRKRARDVPEGGDKADMNLTGMDHDERVKTLFPDRDSQTAFVKNISWDVTEAELAEFFDGRGGTVSARIIKDRATGKSRGIAYVDFSEESALNAAIMKSGQELKGRAIDVQRSRPPDGGSSHGGGRGVGRGGGGRGRGPAGRSGGRASHVGGRSGGRGGLGLMPRSVRSDGDDTKGQAKTNADFRAMFVKSAE